jgi:hypothetical protein
MYNLCRRLLLAFAFAKRLPSQKRLPAQKPLCKRIVISASTLAIAFSCPVFANPLNQSPRATNQVSPPPIEAILANVRVKPSIQSNSVRLKVQRQSATKSTTKLTGSNQAKVAVRQSKRNKPADSGSNLFNINQSTNRYDNLTAVNRLID